MSSDPNQEPVESSQLLAVSEPVVSAAGTAPSPAHQPDESVPRQQLASSEPALSQRGMAPSPPSSRKTSWRWLSLVILVLVIAGAVITTILLAPNSSRAADTVVQDYYNAVERQDYATAYRYLNHQVSVSSSQLQMFSPTAYTQNALSIDQTAGKLTAYTISSTSITNGVATVIIERTRGGNTAEGFVEVQQVGDTWEISAIVVGWSIPS